MLPTEAGHQRKHATHATYITPASTPPTLARIPRHFSNSVWVDKGSEFYNRSMESWLEENDIEMYSKHNEGKSAIAERIIRTLKNRTCKYMTSTWKNVYIDKLDDIVNKYKNTNHSPIKMKPVDVKANTYIDSSKENNKDTKFKIDNIVRISKYQSFVQNRSEGVFVIQKVKNTVLCAYAISDLNGEEIVGTFFEKELQKTTQKEFRVDIAIREKVINYTLGGKATTIRLIAGFIKKTV